MQTFYLGLHLPHYLSISDVPLFISDRLLRKRKSYPIAKTKWGLDSGGFTELNMHGRWITTSDEYISRVKVYKEVIGKLSFAAPQDWMCEAQVLKKTGKNVPYHIDRTVDNFLLLREELGAVVIPVIQGFTLAEYMSCINEYAKHGIDLTTESTVGLGTICRRQHTLEAQSIIRTIAELGISLHGFGLKITALKNISTVIKSADSMAWSYGARVTNEKLAGCTHSGNCANCFTYAKEWYNAKIKEFVV
jgi:hypothetical protein